MKAILTTLLLTIAITNTYASEQDYFYSPSYKLVSTKSLCETTEASFGCMAVDSTITIMTTLTGCMDSVLLFKTKTEILDDTVHIYVTTVAETKAQNKDIACIMPSFDFRTINVPSNTFRNVEIHTQKIDSHNF